MLVLSSWKRSRVKVKNVTFATEIVEAKNYIRITGQSRSNKTITNRIEDKDTYMSLLLAVMEQKMVTIAP